MKFYKRPLPNIYIVANIGQVNIKMLKAWNILRKSLLSTSLQSGEHHAQIPQHIRKCLMIFGMCLLKQMKQNFAATNKVVLVLMLRAVVVKLVGATVY